MVHGHSQVGPVQTSRLVPAALGVLGVVAFLLAVVVLGVATTAAVPLGAQ